MIMLIIYHVGKKFKNNTDTFEGEQEQPSRISPPLHHRICKFLKMNC